MYTEPHTTPWAGLHTFIVHLGPQSCRCPGLLSEAAFDCVMDALNWRMPYHLRAFHCSSPETAAANPVLRVMPEFSAPLEAVLFTAPAAPMRLKDKRRKQTDRLCTGCQDQDAFLHQLTDHRSSLIFVHYDA